MPTLQIRAPDNHLQLNREHWTFAYTKSFLWTFAYSSKMSTGHLPTSKLSTGHLPTAQKMSTGHSQIHPNSSLDICLQIIVSFQNHTFFLISSNLLLDLRNETTKANQTTVKFVNECILVIQTYFFACYQSKHIKPIKPATQYHYNG